MNIVRQLQSKFTQLSELLDSRPLTERALIFITTSLAIYMLVFVVLASPLEKADARIQSTIHTKQTEKLILEQELLILTENLRQAPKESKLIRLGELRNELNNTGTFSELMKDLITPREMVRFVDGVLSSNKDISVVRAKNMPAVQLWPDPTAKPATEPTQKSETQNVSTQAIDNRFTIYRHGMLLEVKGRYREVIMFFSTLEQLPWKILWGDVSLTTDDDSDSVATLMIYTLSPEKAWMGL